MFGSGDAARFVGTYVLAVIHEENLNGKLDVNWLGIPSKATTSRMTHGPRSARPHSPPRASPTTAAASRWPSAW